MEVLTSERTSPVFGACVCAEELKLMIRTSLLASAAVFLRRGSRSLVKRACPMWFVPNCISYPSSVVSAGVAIIPALFMRMSSRVEDASTSTAALLMDAKEARSNLRKTMEAFGTTCLISRIAS